ncbi:MAG: DUF11 domain-containing protein, partial [Thiohalorhabdaceae bacterium]
LGIEKSASGSVDPGTQVDFSVEVTNYGPREEPGPVTVTDELPDDTSYDSYSGSGWTCSESGGTVTCDHGGPLAAGDTLPALGLSATVDPTPAETLTNTATVAGEAFDHNPDNDSDTATLGPKPIRVTLAGEAREVDAGAISLIGTALGGPGASATSTDTNAGSIQTSITPQSDDAWLIDGVGAGETGSFSPDGGQTERWERSVSTATGAGSSYTNTTAGSAVTVGQDHSEMSVNRLVHAVTSWAPMSSASIAFDAATSKADTDTDTLEWNHELAVTGQQKLIVAIALEDAANNANSVESVTFEGDPLTRVTQVSVESGFFTNYEERVEIWYLDLEFRQL